MVHGLDTLKRINDEAAEKIPAIDQAIACCDELVVIHAKRYLRDKNAKTNSGYHAGATDVLTSFADLLREIKSQCQ